MFHFRLEMPWYLMSLYGAAMIGVVILLRLFLKKRLPKTLFPALWGLVLIRLLVPFSLSTPMSLPVPELIFPVEAVANTVVQATPGTASTVVMKDTAHLTQAETSVEYIPDVSFVYPYWNPAALLGLAAVGGTVASGVILLLQYRRSGKQLRESYLVEHNRVINETLERCGVHNALVFTNDSITSPLVSGVINPRIYLPSGMDFTNEALLGHIILHEAVHIRRGDNLIKLIMAVALCVHWFNPLVWVMARLLPADLESACDESVLRHLNGARQEYALSLLSMAHPTGRQTLLYSAFCKSEVERRVRGVLSYKKATAALLAVSLAVVLGAGTVFAAGVQGPYDRYLSSYCSSDTSNWAVKAGLARDAALGASASSRADKAILQQLKTDVKDPDILREQVRTALAKEFGVEKNAFNVEVSLSRSEEELLKEYAQWKLTKRADGRYLLDKELVRGVWDKMAGYAQTYGDGTVNLEIQRDRLGNITSLGEKRKGDPNFDEYELRVYDVVYASDVTTEVVAGTRY